MFTYRHTGGATIHPFFLLVYPSVSTSLSFTLLSKYCSKAIISFADKNELNLSLITAGDSPAVIARIPSTIISFISTSRFHFSLSLFANVDHNLNPVILTNKQSLNPSDLH